VSFPGPWGGPHDPPPPAPPRRLRISRGAVLWLLLLVIAAVAFWVMTSISPGELKGLDWPEALQLFGLLALVSTGLLATRRIDLGRTVRQASIWVAIVLVLLIGYSYRVELSGVAERVRGALLPAYATQTGPRSIALQRSDGGGFFVVGQANGQPVRFAIDTGASDIVLSPDDARRIGVDPESLSYSAPSETANGVGYSAPFVLHSLAVGPIRLTDVRVSVNRTPMTVSLLGMSFLKQLDSFEMKGDQLFLKGKG